MQAIQFETVVNGNSIRIPEQYMGEIPYSVMVTLVPTSKTRPKLKPRAKAGELSIDDFTPFIDTRNFKFDREEANERR